jgi:hypothetical protein
MEPKNATPDATRVGSYDERKRPKKTVEKKKKTRRKAKVEEILPKPGQYFFFRVGSDKYGYMVKSVYDQKKGVLELENGDLIKKVKGVYKRVTYNPRTNRYSMVKLFKYNRYVFKGDECVKTVLDPCF